eukprot:2947688-Pleurochrysis_carterae.AAC.2
MRCAAQACVGSRGAHSVVQGEHRLRAQPLEECRSRRVPKQLHRAHRALRRNSGLSPARACVRFRARARARVYVRLAPGTVPCGGSVREHVHASHSPTQVTNTAPRSNGRRERDTRQKTIHLQPCTIRIFLCASSAATFCREACSLIA